MDKSKCVYCGEVLKGRTDKRFCDANCRSAWHNANTNPGETEIKKINKILRKNRSLLRFFSPEGKTTIKKDLLGKSGFRFKYLTQVYTTKAGNTYRLCYDYGYLILEEDKVLIIKKQKYM